MNFIRRCEDVQRFTTGSARETLVAKKEGGLGLGSPDKREKFSKRNGSR